jgi:hypothetical protein
MANFLEVQQFHRDFWRTRLTTKILSLKAAREKRDAVSPGDKRGNDG